jgi:hypothetical protein
VQEHAAKVGEALLLLHGRARTQQLQLEWRLVFQGLSLSLSLVWLRHMTSDFLLM